MKFKTIIRDSILFPGGFVKWSLCKYDFIFIKSDEVVEVGFNRTDAKLSGETAGLFQCSYGPFSIRAASNRSVRIKGITFSCGMILHKNFFTTDFDQAPFLAMLQESAPLEACRSGILKAMENFNLPQQQQGNRERIDPRLIQLNRYIRTNYTAPITLQDLADFVGVHPTYLSNTYSKVFKISPIFYVNQLRMNAAKELLIQSDKSINEIAHTVGYNSVSQFSLIFKRFHSKTPSAFRRESMESRETD
ncbi:helix-turn-helix domain-containing protein [Paenibacillus kobensis]|uniref:helix-turn-helix domain-containing protein n=1 Tax=Paenibacillus kobensis TaxID=59841 RepID=UPI0013E34CF4|nr:AraC family transcriptional regulator [Paenibacillus kobensis]